MANLITIFRVVLVFFIIAILVLWKEHQFVYWLAFALTILVIYFDCLDGYIARKYNLVSKLGAVLDIIGDRIVENVYWISFAAIGWVPLWVPLIVVSRGILTDGIRSLALEKGMTAFGQASMMQSKIGKFLVSSNFSRASYAVFKAIAFCLLIIANMPNLNWGILNQWIWYLAYFSVYATVFFCIVRGLPVIIEGKRFFDEDKKST